MFDMKKESGFAVTSQSGLCVATMPASLVSVTFRDRAFRSRTLVLLDGSGLIVEKSTVTVSKEEQITALDSHPDFERVADGS
jgi:hypothetical protein